MTVTEVELKIAEIQLDIDQMRLSGIPEEIIQEKEKQLRIYNDMVDAIQKHRYGTDLDRSCPNMLLKEVSKITGVPAGDIFRKTRKREIVDSRRLYAYLLRTTDPREQRIIPYNDTKFVSRGKHMDGRDSPNCLARHIDKDHASVLYLIRTTFELMDSDKHYREVVNEIQQRLLNGEIPMPDISIKAYDNEISA
jgi:hypothetical protein